MATGREKIFIFPIGKIEKFISMVYRINHLSYNASEISIDLKMLYVRYLGDKALIKVE